MAHMMETSKMNIQREMVLLTRMLEDGQTTSLQAGGKTKSSRASRIQYCKVEVEHLVPKHPEFSIVSWS